METVSIAVWDVPLPAVTGEHFAIKVGVKSQRAASDGAVEVCDGGGKVVASARLGGEPWPGTEALRWTAIKVPAPASHGLAEFTVRCAGASSRFCVAVVGKPEHRLTVKVAERGSAAPLEGVEIRLGAFHARTDAAGRAELKVCKGAYRLQAWKAAHDAPALPIEINGDLSLEVVMVHVPEDHPDARWVR